MKQQPPAEVINALAAYTPGKQSGIPVHTTAIGNGLINESFRITVGNSPDIFLQKINTNVFTNPLLIQENYLQLWLHRDTTEGSFFLPKPVFFSGNNTLFTDNDGGQWRAFEFVNDSIAFTIAESIEQAGATARTFGQFTLFFANMDCQMLQPVIPDFHNLSFRYGQFQASLQNGIQERITASLHLIQELSARVRYVQFYQHITNSPEDFPLRVMHHDAKIANVLFQRVTGEVICPVDYDTVMPGYFFSDLGDMIRSMGGTDENSATNQLRTAYYETITGEYVRILKDSLTDEERKHIHYAGLIMIYMQVIRFLTDHLNGDTYYKVNYPGQNAERAANQFGLLLSLEEYLKEKKVAL